MRARVLVRPKQGILDPQGQAVERAHARHYGAVRSSQAVNSSPLMRS